MNYKTTERGFTLIELLVVIAIIGLLSSVILASLNGARKKGRDARRLADIKQLQLALELYNSDQAASGYPDALSDLTAPTVYIQQVPKDPGNGSDYGYSGDATIYCLGARLEGTPPLSASCAPTTQCSGTGGCNYTVAP